ncbi:MAG: L-serine ammonia-lyase, partial [Victivallales bacterium]|nr:L-serine ammonia-lyase [Victivallales bacterium]
GSLSETGRGHGTDKAVAAGLLGMKPESCDPDRVLALLPDASATYRFGPDGQTISFSADDFIFAPRTEGLKFQNTIRFELTDRAGATVFSRTYYSIGGGFILCEGESEPEPGIPPYLYANMRQFRHTVVSTGLEPVEIIRRNEQALSGLTGEEIDRRLDRIIAVMTGSVTNGLCTVGVLPGSIGLQRKAKDLYVRALDTITSLDRYILMMNAFAMAASEENAAGRLVVTAPTSGASGVIPGIIRFLQEQQAVEPEQLRDGLLIAALIAFIAKHNASISGAEVGCQGEVGVASAMAAAMLAQINGCTINVIENAAESALEHHLGLTCDPIGGYVQIPCIERNAVGAVTAYNAYLLASGGNPNKHKLSFDEVIEAMLETGKDMSPSYKETSRGGLAACSVSCFRHC